MQRLPLAVCTLVLLYLHCCQPCAADRNLGLMRRAALLHGNVLTTRSILDKRRLQESSETNTERSIWLLGFPPEQQSSIHDTLAAHGGVLVHGLPGQDHHWMVSANSHCVENLLHAHPDLTTGLLPHDMKISPDVLRLLQGSHQQGEFQMVLMVLMPHINCTDLDIMAASTAQQLAARQQLTAGTACKLYVQPVTHGLQIALCQQDLELAVQHLSASSDITWIDVLPPIQTHNLHAAATVQNPSTMEVPIPPADVQQGVASGHFPYWAVGLDGTGQVVGVVDDGLDLDSCFFYDPTIDIQNSTYLTPMPPFVAANAGDANLDGKNDSYVSTLQNVTVYENTQHRKVVQYVMWADGEPDLHGTHVTGSLVGSAYNTDFKTNPSLATGIAPGAKVAFFDVGTKNAAALSIYNFMDPAQIYDIQRKVGAKVISNSWGLPLSDYPQPKCYMYDAYTWSMQDTLLVFSAGNDGALIDLLNTVGTIAAPGSCKNTLTVGATEGWIDPDLYNLPYFNLSQNGKPLPNKFNYQASSIEYKGETNKPRIVDANGNILQTLVNWFYYSSDVQAGDNSYIWMTAMDMDLDVQLLNVERQQPPEIDWSFISNLQPLANKTSIKLVMAQPEDACQPLQGTYQRTVPGQAILVLVRKTTQGCPGSVSLAHVYNASADGVIMYWSDGLGPYLSGSSAFKGVQYPAITISPSMGNQIRAAINSDFGWSLLLDPIRDSPVPVENVAGFSSFSSAAPYNKVPTTSFADLDVRIKPEIMTPGYLLSAVSDMVQSGTMDECAVTFEEGTSMAAPIAAGSAVIVRQYFEDGFYPSGKADKNSSYSPSAPLVKAMLIAGTAAMTGVSRVDGLKLQPPPSAFQGFGRVDLSASLPLAGDTKQWRLQVVDQAEFQQDGIEHKYNLTVPANQTSKPLIFTLAWHDFPAFPGALYVLVNNLDLVVKAPDGKVWWGNDRPEGDYQNNVEKIFIPQPVAGLYAIEVRATYLFGGARPQQYALVALGGFQGNLNSPSNPAVNASTSPPQQ